MKYKNLYFPILLALILTIAGCFKDDVEIDVDKLTELGPVEFTGPIINVSLKAEDLLKKMSDSISDYIFVREDSVVCIKYTDSIYAEWDEVVAIESIDMPFDYSPDELLKSTDIALNVEERIKINGANNQRLDEMIIQSSILNLHIDFPDNLEGEVTVTFPELTLNNEQLVLVYDAADGSTSKEANLAGYTVIFSQGQDSSYITMAIASDNITGITPATGNFHAHLELTTLVPEIVYGFFGQDTVMNEETSFTFTFYNDLDVKGMIEFYDMEILVGFDNYFGLPFNGSLENATLRNRENNNDMDLQFLGNNTLFVEPASYADEIIPKFNEYTLDRTNSNIIDALNFFPDEMDYRLIVQVNPDNTTDTNFVTQKNQIAGNITMIIPMWLRTEAYIRTDTLNNFDTFSELEDKDIDYFEEGTIAFWFSNYFPFEIEAQIYFVDENYSPVDSVFRTNDKFLETGTLNSQDVVTEPGETITRITLSQEQVRFYKENNVTALILKTSTSTANDGADFVKLLDTYGIDFKVATEIIGDAAVEQ